MYMNKHLEESLSECKCTAERILEKAVYEFNMKIEREWYDHAWRNFTLDDASYYLKGYIPSMYNVGDFESIGFGWSDVRECWFIMKNDHSDWSDLMTFYRKDLAGAIEEAWLRLGFDTYWGIDVKEVRWNEGGFHDIEV